jgi:hypothetical protein
MPTDKAAGLADKAAHLDIDLSRGLDLPPLCPEHIGHTGFGSLSSSSSRQRPSGSGGGSATGGVYSAIRRVAPLTEMHACLRARLATREMTAVTISLRPTVAVHFYANLSPRWARAGGASCAKP